LSSPPDLAERIYRLVLHAYPPEYLETFGDEMHTTFLDGSNEARSQGTFGLFLLRELLDAPKVLVNAYWYWWRRKLQTGIQILQEVTSSSDLPPVPPDGRVSKRQVLFECSLFIIAGLVLILAAYSPLPGLSSGWQRDPELLGKIIVPLTLPLFLLGLVHGLPRWAYPLSGMLLGYYGLVSNQTSLWLFLIVLLFASSILALVAILTDPQPSLLPILFRRIGQSLSLDWTRLSFALYGAMPLVILMAFDDSHYNNRTPYFALSVLVMMVSALIYCRSHTKLMQMSALLAGITLSIGCAWLDRIFFANGLINWIIVSSQGTAGNSWIVILWFQWIVLLLSPALLVTLGRTINLRQAT